MTLLGGFTEAVGLPEPPIIEHSPIEDRGKIQGTHKVPDVMLKRGLVEAAELSNWITEARTSKTSASSEMIVTLRNEADAPIMSWRLTYALPMRYTGPPLSGRLDEAAIEELVLSGRSVEIVPPQG